MATAAKSALVQDDELYDQLYDVKREAEELGNYIDVDPNPLMGALREKGPIHRGFLRELLGLPAYHRHKGALDRPGFTTFGFDACEKAFRDNLNLSNKTYHLDGSPERTMGILEMDNPEHHAFRKAVQALFIKPRAAKWWRENFIDRLVCDLIENLRGLDRAELNMQLCARVPVHTITRAVGLRGDDAMLFRNALIGAASLGHSLEKRMEAHGTVHRMLMEQILKRRQDPGTDIISWLIAAEIDPPGGGTRHLTDGEIVVFARLILLAGGGTTWRQLGIVLLELLNDRDQLEAVRADRSLVDAAIEESLRLNPTNPLFTRIALRDTELAGMAIPKGAIVDICLGAANRDPARWDNPDIFDVRRPFQQHLGTGIGAHMCLGRFVAQVEMNVAINRLFDEFPDLRLDPDKQRPYITGGLEQRGVSGLHVLLR